MKLPKKLFGAKGIFAVLIATLLFAAMAPCVSAQENKALQVKIVTPKNVVEGKSYWILVYVKDANTKRAVKANVYLSGLTQGATATKGGLARFKYTAPQTVATTLQSHITATVTATGYPFTRVTKNVTVKSRLNVEVIYDAQYQTNKRMTRVRVTSDNRPVSGAKVFVSGSRLANNFDTRTVYTNERGIATFTYNIPAVEGSCRTYDLSFKATRYPYYRGTTAIKVRI